MKEWKETPEGFRGDVIIESYPGREGRDVWVENACVVKLGHQRSGSGPKSFGGAKDWPFVKCIVPFCEKDIDRARKFYDKLKVLIEEEFKGEEPPPEEE